MTVLFGNRDTYGGRITAAIASIPGVVGDYAVTARWQQTCTGAGSGRPFAQSEHAESLSGGRCRARADEQRSGAGNGGGSHADIHRDLRPMRHVYSIAGIQLQSSRGNGKVDVAPVVDRVRRFTHELVKNKSGNALRCAHFLIDQRHDSGEGWGCDRCSAISCKTVQGAAAGLILLANQVETAQESVAGEKRNVWKVAQVIVRNPGTTLPGRFGITLAAGSWNLTVHHAVAGAAAPAGRV